MKKGYDITETGLRPRYPSGYKCSPLTSFYASWTDVDGSPRDEIHSGVDGGRLGEPILAPGPGTVRAAWKANWGWGEEGALLIRHSRESLNLKDGPPYYYSAFYHLDYEDVRKIAPGQKIKRGQQLARVSRPGGKSIYMPEVHWEVYEVDDDTELEWETNEFGAPTWSNETARLIDPLYMLGRHKPPDDQRTVEIVPYTPDGNYRGFRGFSYILPCKKRDVP